MTPNSEPSLHATSPFAGTSSTVIYGSNAFVPLAGTVVVACAGFASPARTAAVPPTTQITAVAIPFAALANALRLDLLQERLLDAHRFLQPPSGTNISPLRPPPQGNCAETTTTESAPAPPASTSTAAPAVALTPTASVRGHHLKDLSSIDTSLRPLEFERELRYHPDKGFVSRLLTHLRHGFNIGYNGPQFMHIAQHLPTAHTHAHIIDAAIAKECHACRMAGPFPTPPLTNMRCSGLGVVPKKDGGWRVICHLSAPHGRSINDSIDADAFSLTYSSVDDAISIINTLGPGSLMGKIDLKNAFRLCPVRPQDRHLLGIHWKGAFYVDKCLPFGLRSAPFLFNTVATALEWILANNYGIHHLIHYLDDFFTAGPPHSITCRESMSTMLEVCSRLGAPVKPEKVEGPSTTLTFLGIQLDSVSMQASITAERKRELRDELTRFHHRRTCTKRELLSLIGKLSFACKVVPAGRIFLRRLIDLSTTVTPLHHHVTMDEAARLDIQWWHDFLPTWSGTSLFLDTYWTKAPDIELYTDASSTIGFGAYWAGRWFNGHWTASQDQHSITWKELFAIVVAAATWGNLWSRRKILFHCDNEAVVSIWRKGSSRAKDVMVLVRTLYFTAAHNNFNIAVTHIAGANNRIADALSRFSLQAFQELAPNANAEPTLPNIPAPLIEP